MSIEDIIRAVVREEIIHARLTAPTAPTIGGKRLVDEHGNDGTADVLDAMDPGWRARQAPAVDAGRLAEALSVEIRRRGATWSGIGAAEQTEAMRRALATVGAGLTVAPVVWRDGDGQSKATMGLLSLRAYDAGGWSVYGPREGEAAIAGGGAGHGNLATAKAAAVAFAASINGATISPPAVPETEPVAWGVEDDEGRVRYPSLSPGEAVARGGTKGGKPRTAVPLYRSPPAVPREAVTVEQIVGAWDSIASNAPTSSLPSDAVRAAVGRFVGSVIAAGEEK